MSRKLDEIPLLSLDDGKKKKIIVHVDEEDDDPIEIYSIGHRQVVLWPFDFILLLVEFVQIYSVLLVLSKSWGWPIEWIDGSRFTHLLNLDIWEFVVLQSGSYTAKNAPIHTEDVRIGSSTFDYRYYTIAWSIFVFLVAISFVIAHAIIGYVRPMASLLYQSRVRRAFMFTAQLFCLPFGVAVARLYHCTTETRDNVAEGVLRVSNNISCWTAQHWAFAAPPIFLLALYMGVSFLMIRDVKRQLFSKSGSRHEGYVQLKEAEYLLGMDLIWAVGNFSLFSSFRRRGVYYRPVIFLIKCLVLLFYGGLVTWPSLQAILMSAIFLLTALLFLGLQPFRIAVFNVLIVCLWFFLTCYGVLGVLLELEVESSLLTGRYLLGDLITVTAVSTLVLLISLIYMLVRHYSHVHPLWPSLAHPKSGNLDANTTRYMKGILRGRRLLEISYSVAPMLAPAHELSHHIQVINAYCREAEQMNDPVHDTLWDLLDELIEAHTNVSPQSIYSTSSKKSVHKIACELNEIMPAFKKRLDQREHDFALMSTAKRRMLLKMFVLGVFVNGRAEKMKLKQQKVDIKPRYLMPDDEQSRSSVTIGGSEAAEEEENEALFAKVEELVGDSGQAQMTDSREKLLQEVEAVMGDSQSPV
eukprot:m.310298 g.310298  ORF g.310298 m.310298 type:complete len:639 (+) comp50751_c0_seq1:45-1961(+)